MSEQIKYTQNEVSLAEKVEQAEQTRFFHGDSNLFLVNQREQTTAQTRLNLVMMLAELQRIKGNMRYFIKAS